MDRAEIKSQRELARRLGISGPSVNGWAMGKHLPDMRHMLDLAGWSGTCVEYLWTSRGARFPQDGHPVDVEILIALLDQLDDDRRAAVVNFAKFQVQG